MTQRLRVRKELLYLLSSILVLTVFYLMPDVFDGERNPECTMKAALSYATFAWVLIAALALIDIAWLISYYGVSEKKNGTDMLQFAGRIVYISEIAKILVNPIGFTVFFIWNQALWTELSSACFSGYNLMDFFIWLQVLLVTSISALFCFMTILCAPCAYM